MTFPYTLFAGMAFVAALTCSSPTAAQCSLPADMTGTWRANDGGTYYVRQVGANVWWYGMSGDNGVSWSNVFAGQRNGQLVVGTWADVPRGRTRNSGVLHLMIGNSGPNGTGGVTGWRKIMMTGGFTGSSWYSLCGDSAVAPNP